VPNRAELSKEVSPEALEEEMKRMKRVEEKRRRDIEDEKQNGTGNLDSVRVWEMESFDRNVREDYGDWVDGVASNRSFASPAYRLECLEFSNQLSVLENLAAQARTIAHDRDSEINREVVQGTPKLEALGASGTAHEVND
jgi:hypothetical protein